MLNILFSTFLFDLIYSGDCFISIGRDPLLKKTKAKQQSSAQMYPLIFNQFAVNAHLGF